MLYGAAVHQTSMVAGSQVACSGHPDSAGRLLPGNEREHRPAAVGGGQRGGQQPRYSAAGHDGIRIAADVGDGGLGDVLDAPRGLVPADRVAPAGVAADRGRGQAGHGGGAQPLAVPRQRRRQASRGVRRTGRRSSRSP